MSNDKNDKAQQEYQKFLKERNWDFDELRGPTARGPFAATTELNADVATDTIQHQATAKPALRLVNGGS